MRLNLEYFYVVLDNGAVSPTFPTYEQAAKYLRSKKKQGFNGEIKYSKASGPPKKNPRKRKSASAKTVEHRNPRGVLSKYRYAVQYSDNGKTWHDHGIFTHREIAEDIAQTLSRKYPTVYIRVAEK